MYIPALKTFLNHIKRLLFLSKLRSERYNRKQTLSERVESDLAKGDHTMAVRRLEGSLKHNPLDEVVLDKIASIFNAYGLKEKAGRYWYLREVKKEHQLEAVKSFEQSLGNDPTLILKTLITQTKYSFSRLRDDQLFILEELLKRVKQQEGTTPKFLRALESHIVKRQKKRLT